MFFFRLPKTLQFLLGSFWATAGKAPSGPLGPHIGPHKYFRFPMGRPPRALVGPGFEVYQDSAAPLSSQPKCLRDAYLRPALGSFGDLCAPLGPLGTPLGSLKHLCNPFGPFCAHMEDYGHVRATTNGRVTTNMYIKRRTCTGGHETAILRAGALGSLGSAQDALGFIGLPSLPRIMASALPSPRQHERHLG